VEARSHREARRLRGIDFRRVLESLQTLHHPPRMIHEGLGLVGFVGFAVHFALDAPCRLEPPVSLPNIPLRVESAIDLAANKLAALYGRASAKDFVDLYFVHHDIISIEQLADFDLRFCIRTSVRAWRKI
jgi:hypothetical protein